MIASPSIYASSARFDAARALGEDDMRRLAPSIFAVEAHDSRSPKFRPIPTIEILRGLQKEGFHPVGVRQSTTRDPSRRDYTKHMIRLRKLDDQAKYSVGDTVFEMLLKNANDGSAAYDLLGALWRIRCLNSLVAKLGDVDSVKVRHSGSAERVRDGVIEGTFRVLGTAERVLAAPDAWGALQLVKDERAALAEAAHVLRFGAVEQGTGGIAEAVHPADLLQPRRAADTGTDLWTTFNVVQEHILKGGDQGMYRDAQNRLRRATSRAVKGVDQSTALNQALWVLGQRMAELKGTPVAA